MNDSALLWVSPDLTDITDQTSRTRIIGEVSDCNEFINNAYADIAQILLLYELYDSWREQDKLILNISSNSSDAIKIKPHIYSVYKTALDKASQQLSYEKSKCQVCNLRFGWIDTPRVQHVDSPKITTDDACDIIDMVIKSSASGMITELTILPKA